MSKKSIIIAFGILLIVIGIFSFAVSAIGFKVIYQDTAAFVQAKGQILWCKKIYFKRWEDPTCMVEFTAQDGKKISATAVSWNILGRRAGDIVTIIYKPSNPTFIQFSSFLEQSLLPIFGLGIGIVFLFGGIYFIFFVRK